MAAWPRIERAAAAIALAAWLVCFFLSLRDVVQATGASPLLVSRVAARAELPAVERVRRGFEDRVRPLVPGDRLLEIGGRSLAGGGPLEVSMAFATARGEDARVPVRFMRSGEVRKAWIGVATHRPFWPRLVAALLFAGAALFLLLRARRTRLVRFLLWGYLASAFFFACTFVGGPLETAASVGVHVVSLGAALALNAWVALLFPGDRWPASRLVRVAPWVFAGLALADASRFYGFPGSRETGAWLTVIGGIPYLVLCVAAVTRNYRVADPVDRRRLRWFLLGCYIVTAPLLLTSLAAALDPRLDRLPVIALSFAGLLPLFVLIGMLRYNFLDVDGVISKAASYSALLALLLVLLPMGAPAASSALSASMDVDPKISQLGVSVALAFGAIAFHFRLQPRIERAFFPERFALESDLEHLIARLGDCTEASEVARVAGEGLDDLFQPLACAVYLRAGARFVPAFSAGPVKPESFDDDDPLIATLGRRSQPILAEGLEPGGDDAPGPLAVFDRAVLETLGVPLAVPVHRAGSLVAFFFLGRKRSGDVYTATDRSLLAITADKLSSELSRFDQHEMLRAAHAAQERLRRYVPGSLAEELDRGRELEVGRTDVSVLFVDLRGYTAYAEPLSPEEIFGAVNRYTGIVSRIVREQGGTIVEFNGDGMMAVFGTPKPLPRKEAAAARAACEIADAVGSLHEDAAPRLSVGAGVATGPAFVGNVRAIDRWIWTALGNTTNLAARLQALTRELDAEVLLDEATWTAAALPESAWLRHPNVAIRGRRGTETLYGRRRSA